MSARIKDTAFSRAVGGHYRKITGEALLEDCRKSIIQNQECDGASINPFRIEDADQIYDGTKRSFVSSRPFEVGDKMVAFCEPKTGAHYRWAILQITQTEPWADGVPTGHWLYSFDVLSKGEVGALS